LFDFSPGQNRAIERIEQAGEGEFIFVTGKAGTGKSTVLRWIRGKYPCIVLAPTGLAAVNVGGQTIHSFFRFKTGGLSRSDAKPLAADRALAVRKARFIIVDEISMVRADLLDAVDASLRKTLGVNRPFGGKTIVAIGDMWQLEPVVTNDERERFVGMPYKSPFWFDARVFNHDGPLFDEETRVETYELADVFRQVGNPAFVDALNAVRTGDPAGLFYINARAGIEAEGMPVRITFGNRRADDVNAVELDRIEGLGEVFHAEVTGEFEMKNPPAPITLELKIGARVMVTRNTFDYRGEQSVVNGDVGTVTGFYEVGPQVLLDDGRHVILDRAEWEAKTQTYDTTTDTIGERVSGTMRQYPLRLAWAITAHKSQGATMDNVQLELEMPAFSHGQLYVALSRVRTFEGLHLRRKLTPKDIVVNPRVVEFFGAPAARESLFDMEALA
jgi:ATP-dependent DNA helicase PIF1